MKNDKDAKLMSGLVGCGVWTELVTNLDRLALYARTGPPLRELSRPLLVAPRTAGLSVDHAHEWYGQMRSVQLVANAICNYINTGGDLRVLGEVIKNLFMATKLSPDERVTFDGWRLVDAQPYVIGVDMGEGHSVGVGQLYSFDADRGDQVVRVNVVPGIGIQSREYIDREDYEANYTAQVSRETDVFNFRTLDSSG